MRKVQRARGEIEQAARRGWSRVCFSEREELKKKK